MSFKHSFGMVCIVVLLLGCSGEPTTNDTGLPPGALGPLQTIEAQLNGVPVTIEVAITQTEQAQGLMYRESMPQNHGMLFVYDEPRFMGFWMKNTLIPLDIAYIREDLSIGNIETMTPHKGPFTPPSYRSMYPSLYALEMNAGWFAENGFTAGDTIDLPTEAIQELIKQ